MEHAPLTFFKKLVQTPSPSGYEQPAQEIIRNYAENFADSVTTDVLGNVIAVRNPDAPVRVMLAGHVDQIGLNVQYVDDNGYIYFLALGGWDIQVLVGQHVTIWTLSGPIPGVIGRKPIHLLKEDERKRAPRLSELWIDIGAATKEEVTQVVRIGDPITINLTVTELMQNRISGSGMDDKSGAWVVMEALRRADASKLKCAAYAVATVQEELGLRGATGSAYGVNPHVGIAVDVTFSSDCPTIEKKEEGEVSLGAGAVITRGPNMNPKVVNMLIDIAVGNDIKYQLTASGSPPGTDARVIQLTRGGVASGLISIPNRYMHSPVEIVSLDDMDAAADLLARFLESVDDTTDFIPRVG